MLGYWEDPERTEQTIDPEGWLIPAISVKWMQRVT